MTLKKKEKKKSRIVRGEEDGGDEGREQKFTRQKCMGESGGAEVYAAVALRRERV